MPRKAALLLASALLSLVDASAVDATAVQLNPGAAGTLSSDLTVPFTGLNGTALNGQNLMLDFTFSNSEFVRLFTITKSFSISVRLQTSSASFVGFLDGTGFLSDSLSNEIEPAETLGSAATANGGMTVSLSPTVGRPLDFYDVHFNLTFPTDPGVSVTGGQFRLFTSGNAPSSLFGIGPGVPRDIVPETGGTIALLGLGVVAISLFARRLNRKSRFSSPG